MSGYVWNHQGGIAPTTGAALSRARRADLGTLPVSIPGTNCGNCKFFAPRETLNGVSVGGCFHPEVLQEVTDRMCCAFWDAPGYLRV